MKNVFFLILVLISTASFAQTQWVGKKAPEINVDKWLHSEINSNPLSIDLENSSDNIDFILLDFWYTKCAPCVAKIPELNEIADKYSNIKVLSITFENENTINSFLEKCSINYPIGIDTNRNTISSYNVALYPSTFLIDKNGIIVWQCDFDPLSLTANSLPLIISKINSTITLSLNKPENQNKDSKYSFTLKKSEFVTKGNYHEMSPFYVNIFNKDVYFMLKLFWEINSSRIINANSTMLNTKYDFTLETDKYDNPEEINCLEIAKMILPNELEINPEPISIDTTYYVLKPENDSLLNVHISDRKFYGDSHNFATPNDTISTIWKAKGSTLNNLKDYLENQFNMLVKVDMPDTIRYNFTLSLVSRTETEKILSEKYGINLVEEKGELEMWKLK